MATFEFQYPDALIPRTAPRVVEILEAWESHPVAQKILTWLGKPDISSLTAKEKVAMYCQIQLWKAMRDVEINDAVTAANAAAIAASEADFTL